MSTGITIVLIVVFALAGVVAGVLYQERVRGKSQKMQVQLNYEERLRQVKEENERRLVELQTQQRDALRESKEESARVRSTLETENRERRQEVQRMEQRLQQKEESLDRKMGDLERREPEDAGAAQLRRAIATGQGGKRTPSGRAADSAARRPT